MAKSKKAKPAKPAPTDVADVLDDDVTSTSLTSEDWAFIERVSTFHFHIQAYAARASLHGYDDDEHEFGKALLTKAAGRDRPLSHWVAESTHDGQEGQFSAEQTRLLQEIDTFENTWFPRVRAILLRTIPEERVGIFVGAFFKDLSQQPFGPTVLDSVSTLLDRFESLAHSDEPGAKEAFALGKKRGLTKGKMAHIRGLIEAATKAGPVAKPAKLSPKQLALAKQEQLAAVRKLRPWFNDWATTFRDVFGTRALIRLGLVAMKRSTRGDVEGVDDATDDDDTSGESEDVGGETETKAKPKGGEGGK